MHIKRYFQTLEWHSSVYIVTHIYGLNTESQKVFVNVMSLYFTNNSPGNPPDQNVPSSFCLEEQLTGERPPIGHTKAGKTIYSGSLVVYLREFLLIALQNSLGDKRIFNILSSLKL